MSEILLCRTALRFPFDFFPTPAPDDGSVASANRQTFAEPHGHIFRPGVFRLCRNYGARLFQELDVILARLKFRARSNILLVYG